MDYCVPYDRAEALIPGVGQHLIEEMARRSEINNEGTSATHVACTVRTASGRSTWLI